MQFYFMLFGFYTATFITVSVETDNVTEYLFKAIRFAVTFAVQLKYANKADLKPFGCSHLCSSLPNTLFPFLLSSVGPLCSVPLQTAGVRSDCQFNRKILLCS